jgi:hypothetical protein
MIQQIAQIVQSVDNQASNSYKRGMIKVLISIFRIYRRDKSKSSALTDRQIPPIPNLM